MPDFLRKNIRLPASQYIGRNWYFLTLVVEGRERRFFNASRVAENLSLLTKHAQSGHFAISAYCFMPDHLHILTMESRTNPTSCRLPKPLSRIQPSLSSSKPSGVCGKRNTMTTYCGRMSGGNQLPATSG
jgi:REP element-mobilizing transposase RayT